MPNRTEGSCPICLLSPWATSELCIRHIRHIGMQDVLSQHHEDWPWGALPAPLQSQGVRWHAKRSLWRLQGRFSLPARPAVTFQPVQLQSVAGGSWTNGGGHQLGLRYFIWLQKHRDPAEPDDHPGESQALFCSTKLCGFCRLQQG